MPRRDIAGAHLSTRASLLPSRSTGVTDFMIKLTHFERRGHRCVGEIAFPYLEIAS
jgi:hypothetical protein